MTMTYLASVISAARQRADAFAAKIRAPARRGSPGSPIDTLLAGDLARLLGGEDMSHKAEQLKHYKGRVFAAVHLKAKRIAGQSVRVARKKSGKVESGKTPFAILAKSARSASEFEAMRQWLPSAVKDDNDNLEVLPDHEILRAINDPNRAMVQGTLIYAAVVNLEMTGQGFWQFKQLKKPDADGRTVHGTYWPSNWVTPNHKEGLFGGWDVEIGGRGQKQYVPSSEMTYFFNPDPADPLGALSPVQALATSIAADEGVSEAQRRMFTNGIFAGLMFVVGRNPDIAGKLGERSMLTKEQRKEIISWVKQMHRGVERSGEPIITDALLTDVKQIFPGIREFDFLASAGLTESQINKGLHVNPISMGQVEGANRASSAIAESHLVANALNPVIQQMSNCMSQWLVPMFDSKENLVCFIEPCQPIDREMDLKEMDLQLKTGTKYFNEWRSKFNLEPIKELEEFLVTAAGPRKVEDIVNPPAPVDPKTGLALGAVEEEDEEEDEENADKEEKDKSASTRIAKLLTEEDGSRTLVELERGRIVKLETDADGNRILIESKV